MLSHKNEKFVKNPNIKNMRSKKSLTQKNCVYRKLLAKWYLQNIVENILMNQSLSKILFIYIILSSIIQEVSKDMKHVDLSERETKQIEYLTQTLIFWSLYLCNILCRRPLIFQTINSVRSDHPSLKNQRCTQSGCKDIGILNFDFFRQTQFLLNLI